MKLKLKIQLACTKVNLILLRKITGLLIQLGNNKGKICLDFNRASNEAFCWNLPLAVERMGIIRKLVKQVES